MMFAIRLFFSSTCNLVQRHGIIFRSAVLLLIAMPAGMPGANAATTQKWTPGWDNFNEPLNFTQSHIAWSVNSTTNVLSVTFKLVGAKPSKNYQASLQFFCASFLQPSANSPTINQGAALAFRRQSMV